MISQEITHSKMPNFSQERLAVTSRENAYSFIPSGREVINRVIDRIGTAKSSICLQYYTFEADETGERVIQALLDAKQKAKQDGRNLRIRLLADNSIDVFHAQGKLTLFNKTAREKRQHTYERLLELHREGIEVKITNYFHFLALRGNFLYRDHKKLALFDGEDFDAVDSSHPPTAIVGSANISNDHDVWKDIGVEMTGRMIKILQDDFDMTFGYAQQFPQVLDVPTLGDYFKSNILTRHFRPFALRKYYRDARAAIVRNVESPGWKKRYDLHAAGDGKGGIIATDGNWQSRREATELANDLIRSLKKGDRLDMGAPFPGMLGMTKALTDAVARGVQVHLITSEKNSYALYNRIKHEGHEANANVIAANWERKMKKAGIQLHIYQGEKGVEPTLHAKFMLVRRNDGPATAYWGSVNFTRDFFAGYNREIAMQTDDPKITQQFANFVDNDLIPHAVLQKQGWRRTTMHDN